MKSWKHVLRFKERQIKTFSIPEVDESFSLLGKISFLYRRLVGKVLNIITIQFKINSIN